MKMIIDSHCHIYPEKIAHKAVAAVDRFYAGLPTPGMMDGTTGCLLDSGQAAGISHFIVHSVATTPAQSRTISHFIAESVEASGGCFTGLGAMHPESEDMEGDFEYLRSLGLKGVKIHPDIQKFHADCENAYKIYDLCDRAGIPVLVHCGDYRYPYSEPERIAHVLRDFPHLKFVGAHFGGWSVWDQAVAALCDFPNLVVDTSSSFPWLSVGHVMDLIRAYGAERVMFGTDYPMWPPESDLEFFRRLPLTEDEREKIAWKNCAELYQIPLSSAAAP